MKLPDSKIGMFIWFGWRIHIAQRAQLIKNAGFETTCLWWADEEKGNTGSLDDLPKIVRDCGLEIDNIHVPYKDTYLLASENPAERRKFIDSYKQWISDCVKHRIPKIVFHTCADVLNPPEPGKLLLDSVEQILKVAESAKIILANENTRRPDYIDFILSRLDSQYLRYCFDSGHNNIWDDKPAEILKRWGHKLVMTHLHDNLGSEDDHMLPFTGKIDWRKIVVNWPQDYKGVLMLEVLGPLRPPVSTRRQAEAGRSEASDDKKQSAESFLKNAFESITKLKALEV